MQLIYDESQKIFIARASFLEKDIPKNAKFRWDPEKKKWWTDDILKAKVLAEFADESCLEMFNTTVNKTIQSIQKWRALKYKIPSPPGQKFMDFQKIGIARMIEILENPKYKGVLLADEMGVGKTIQAIGCLNLAKKISKVLIVCPATLKINWQRELEAWLTHNPSIGIVNSQDTFPGTSIVIINYDLLRKFEDSLRDIQWDFLIADEAHALKNPKSQRSVFLMGGTFLEGKTENNGFSEKRKVKPIPTKHTIFLTGTPVLNRPIEIFPLIHFLNPERWSNSFKFGLEFCGGHKNRWGWDFSGSSNSETLQEELRSTIMIRRLKKEVLKELPPKRRQIIEIPIEEIKLKKIIEEEKIFWETNETEKQRLKDRIKELKGGNEEYIETTKKLKNVKNILFQEMSSLRRKTAIAKIPFAIEYLKEILETNEKVVCFAHHKEVIEKIFQHFQENSAVITGSVPPEKRQAEIDRFQNDPGCHLFVGSIKAAGVGITLTAASHAVFVELDWTPAIMSQSEDRLHRKGQEQSVLIQHLVFNNSLDAKMAKMLIEKQKIIDKIVN